jgi:asparagine N-glycosylation enzyme membrane subunit Stt3
MAKNIGQSRVGNLLGNITFFRPRLSRRKALEVSVLGMTLVLAIIFRVIRVRWGAYMDAFDPLFQYRVTEYVVKNGYAAWFTWHDTLSWYPMGRDIFLSSYPGVPFSAAFVYHLPRPWGSTSRSTTSASTSPC